VKEYFQSLHVLKKTSLNITPKSSYPINVDGYKKNIAFDTKQLIEAKANSSNELKKLLI
jgi:hypothetical protein